MERAAEGQSTLDLLKEQTLPGLAYGRAACWPICSPRRSRRRWKGLPNVYCGFASPWRWPYSYLCCKKVRLREKLLSVGLLAFFLLSFLFRTLDYYWHGGHFPNMLPYRFSFCSASCSSSWPTVRGHCWTASASDILFVILPSASALSCADWGWRAACAGCSERAGAGQLYALRSCCIARSAGGSSSAWRCCLPSSGGNGLQHRPWAWQGLAHVPLVLSTRVCGCAGRSAGRTEGSGRVESHVLPDAQ